MWATDLVDVNESPAYLVNLLSRTGHAGVTNCAAISNYAPPDLMDAAASDLYPGARLVSHDPGDVDDEPGQPPKPRWAPYVADTWAIARRVVELWTPDTPWL